MNDLKITKSEAASFIKNVWKANTVEPLCKNYRNDKFEKITQILNSSTIGKHFIYVIDPFTGKFQFISDEIRKVLGYEPEEFDLPFYISIIHPEDLSYVLEIQMKVNNFCRNNVPEDRINYKYCYDFRVKTKADKYIQVYLQYFYLEMTENHQPVRVITILNDISHIKLGGIPKLNIFKNTEGIINILNENSKQTITLTPKESEIFEFLIKGFTSIDISDALQISVHTVSTHRRNILKRNNCCNTSELLNLYFQTKIERY